MRLFKTKINKDSSRVVIHSLSEALIKKNPNVEKEHINKLLDIMKALNLDIIRL